MAPLRQDGMPFFRQLWTVVMGAPIARATAVVPPSSSIIWAASVCMPQ